VLAVITISWFIFGAYMQITFCHNIRSVRQRVVLAFLYWPLLLAEIAQLFMINVFVLLGGGWKAFGQYRKKVEEEAVNAMFQDLLGATRSRGVPYAE
jgi:hypothetical protein